MATRQVFSKVHQHQPQQQQQVQEVEQIEKLSSTSTLFLRKMDLLVKSTKNFPDLIEEAEKSSTISALEKDTILKQFGSEREKLAALYLLLNGKSCSAKKAADLLKKTGNESAAYVLERDDDDDKRKNGASPPSTTSLNNNETKSLCCGGGTDMPIPEEEKEKWNSLQKLIKANIDRLSSHTRNLGLVLCFASGIGLITGKDREIIANHSQLEIDQLKKFYSMVSTKEADAYGKLLKVLKMTSNNWALHVLKIDDEI